MENVKSFGPEQKGIDWLSLILNLVIIILGITFILLVWHYGLDDCDKLRFDLNGKKLDAGEFMKIYSDECLNKRPTLSLPNLSNQSLYIP